MNKVLKIGTRGSPLAIAQAEIAAAALSAAHAGLETRLVPMTTTGDRILDRTLAEAGGKGLFTKELEDALADGRADIAVHSMKDVPTVLPEGLMIGAILPREDVRDVFFSRHPGGIEGLPPGAVVGTAGLRRQAIILHLRPDVKVIPFRGNVGTRLKKLEDGEADATLLAAAGLKRLGRQDLMKTVLDTSVMLPAVGQGAIGIECRADDAETRALLAAVHCRDSGLRVAAERGFLTAMDGSCRTPMAALAEIAEGGLTLDVLVARPDGKDLRREKHALKVEGEQAAFDAGFNIGKALREKLPEGYFG